MYQKIVGKGVLIVGDLHFSDVFTGKYKNYLENCFDVLAKIRDRVYETRPSALVFLGDIVGMTEGNVKNREVLYQLCSFFQEMNKICQVFCIRGNHDFNGSFPDYQFLAKLGVFKTSGDCDGFFDYFGDESQECPEIRFHLVDYGNEGVEFNIAPEPTVNIVLAHNNFTIKDVTTWYPACDGIELATMSNMQDIYMVISGHIHSPSPQIVQTPTISGSNCLLFYPGCPTRPVIKSSPYESCWFVEFKYNKQENETTYDAVDFPLKPWDEVVYPDEDFVEDKTEEEKQEEIRTEALKEVLDDIMKCRLTQGDLISQVKSIPNASEEAKKLAVGYLQTAIDNRRS